MSRPASSSAALPIAYVVLRILIVMNYAILRRLFAIVETMRAGDPFVAANASRLRAIAWARTLMREALEGTV
jgi:hypothetical protein